MNETTPTAPILDAITGRIKYCLGNISENLIEIGQQLILAKPLVNHGAWQIWLRDNFAMTDRTARNYMRVAERFGKTENVFRFQPSALMELAKLSDAEITNFLVATPSAADMSVRNLREAVKNWRHKFQFSPKVETPVTIDMADTSSDEPIEAYTSAVTLTFDAEQDTITAATIFSVEPNPSNALTFVPAPAPPTKIEQLNLPCFENLPALVQPQRYELPTLITEAAASIDTPYYLIERRDAYAKIPVPSILISTNPLAPWVQRLKSKATATIITRLPMIRAGLLKERNALILYNGTDVDQFAEHFARFGEVNIPYKPKSSDASNARALW